MAMSLAAIVKGPAALARDHLAYPILVSFVPGRFQPGVLKHLPGALKEKTLQLEAVIASSGKNAQPALTEQSPIEHFAYEAACDYTARSGTLEAAAGFGVLVGSALYITATGGGLNSYATVIGAAFGLVDGGFRWVWSVGRSREPGSFAEGLLHFINHNFSSVWRPARHDGSND